jgi:hypothetical protein
MPTPGLLGACSRARLRLRALRALPARALPLPNAGLACGSRGVGGAADSALGYSQDPARTVSAEVPTVFLCAGGVLSLSYQT